MEIRFANISDIPGFVEAGRRVHQLTRFKANGYDETRVGNSLRAIIENPTGAHCFIVAVDTSGCPVGWIIGCIEQHFFSSQLIASIINIGVLPERRMSGAGVRLLSAFRKWATNRGAVELMAGVNSGIDQKRQDRFLRRIGFDLVGGNYAMDLRSAR